MRLTLELIYEADRIGATPVEVWQSQQRLAKDSGRSVSILRACHAIEMERLYGPAPEGYRAKRWEDYL